MEKRPLNHPAVQEWKRTAIGGAVLTAIKLIGILAAAIGYLQLLMPVFERFPWQIGVAILVGPIITTVSMIAVYRMTYIPKSNIRETYDVKLLNPSISLPLDERGDPYATVHMRIENGDEAPMIGMQSQCIVFRSDGTPVRRFTSAMPNPILSGAPMSVELPHVIPPPLTGFICYFGFQFQKPDDVNVYVQCFWMATRFQASGEPEMVNASLNQVNSIIKLTKERGFKPPSPIPDKVEPPPSPTS